MVTCDSGATTDLWQIQASPCRPCKLLNRRDLGATPNVRPHAFSFGYHSPVTEPTYDIRLPFLKWPGGKRWLTRYILPILRTEQINRYFEPFLGGAALYFALRPRRAFLSDINAELINTYKQVRDCHEGLISVLKRIPVTAEEYYTVRRTKSRSLVTRAAHFLFLNRTSFAGIYRLNRKGLFNVPYGGGHRKPNTLWEKNILAAASDALQGTELVACDFESAMRHAKQGDVVYCDPTYTVAHDNNGFVRYNECNFSWLDQERLARSAAKAASAGALVLVSNAHHRDIAELHRTAEQHVVSRMSCLAPAPNHRRSVMEYLFVYRPQRKLRRHDPCIAGKPDQRSGFHT